MPIKVNVNKGNVFQLMKVKGVSQQLAQNIVAYRDKKGLYRTLDELGKNLPLDDHYQIDVTQK